MRPQKNAVTVLELFDRSALTGMAGTGKAAIKQLLSAGTAQRKWRQRRSLPVVNDDNSRKKKRSLAADSVLGQKEV
jgi:hypothetical protein